MNALTMACEAVGGVSALAVAIGVSDVAIHKWKKTGRIPEDRCPAIEAAVAQKGGRVRCEDLRKDVAWERDKKGRVVAYRVPVRRVAA